MSTTLTNGLKLPDKGSVDWYADMQNNYTILDGAVGTVAEHTTQIAGKASATHTHGNITNDGKLATASKALVTDSNKNITTSSVSDTELSYLSGVTSAIQTQLNAKANDSGVVHKTENETIDGIKTFLQPMYNRGSIRFSSDSFVTGTPSNNLFYAPIAIGGLVNSIWNAPFMHNAAIRTTGINDYSIRVYSQTSNTLTGVVAETNADASDISFRPIVNANHNLGTSSYQWKSVYAQSYYYNGTAWGLDKANEWTGTNTFSSATNSVFCFKFGTSGSYSDIRWIDNNGSHYATLRGRVNELSLGLQYSSASAWYSGASVTISNNGNVQIKAYDGTEPWTVNFAPVGVYPTSNNALELGTSTNKWKSFNGINPGSLSFPSGGNTENTDWFNVAGDIVPTGGNATDFTGGQNFFTPSKDGWLALSVVSCKGITVWINSLNYGLSFVAPDATHNRQIIIPVVAGKQVEIKVEGNRWYSARLIVPQGNV